MRYDLDLRISMRNKYQNMEIERSIALAQYLEAETTSEMSELSDKMSKIDKEMDRFFQRYIQFLRGINYGALSDNNWGLRKQSLVSYTSFVRT